MGVDKGTKDYATSWMDATFDAGKEVGDLVNKAIASGDFSSLNSQISSALSSALNQTADAVHDALLGSSVSTGQREMRREGNAYQSAQERSKWYTQTGAEGQHTGAVKIASSGGAMLQQVLGFILGGLNGIFFLTSLLSRNPFGMALFGVLAGVLLAAGFRGKKKLSLITGARRLLKLMKGKEIISIEEVASAFGESKEQALTDLREMLRLGVLTGTAYLDKEGTTFMTTREAYRQYEETMKAYESRKQSEGHKEKRQNSVFRKGDLPEYEKFKAEEAALEESRRKKEAKLDAETQKVLREGRAFIAHIRQKNDEIPGEDFSGKLDRLEHIVTRIFDQVEAEPKSAPDLHRLMSYYLPTTQKLVDTYAELDQHEIQGSNIREAKKEIEDSLDSINDAYERFLDSFFQSTAWDVSSDVSVMKTMMAQDGLTGSDFGKSGQTSTMSGGLHFGDFGSAAAFAPEEEKK